MLVYSLHLGFQSHLHEHLFYGLCCDRKPSRFSDIQSCFYIFPTVKSTQRRLCLRLNSIHSNYHLAQILNNLIAQIQLSCWFIMKFNCLVRVRAQVTFCERTVTGYELNYGMLVSCFRLSLQLIDLVISVNCLKCPVTSFSRSLCNVHL